SEQRLSKEEAGGCGCCCYCEKLKEGSCSFEDGDPLARSRAFSRIEAQTFELYEGQMKMKEGDRTMNHPLYPAKK
ncbi:hypothetical protein PIB30_099703, partial [Stylosanthes scabra]|nr:hypothetical protein [Stylosanthes scabra]